MSRFRRNEEILFEVVRQCFGGYLYHRTDEAHLESIREHGLLSARARQELGIVPAFPGGNMLTSSLDAEKGLDDKVFLSFFDRGLMPKHADARRRPVILKIKPDVLFYRGVKVALGQAGHYSTYTYSPSRAFEEMDWDVIKDMLRGNDLRGYQATRVRKVLNYEVIVPRQVARQDIFKACEIEG